MQRFEETTRAQLQPPLRPPLWHGRLTLGGLVLTLSLNRDVQQTSGLLANRLAELRLERGLTPQELASLLSIAPSTLAALEEGSYQPSLNLALRLSEVFNLPVEAIFSSATGYFA